MQEIENLKSFYKTGFDNIPKDFLQPCLRNCRRWRRGTLGFTSSALKDWAGSFVHILKGVEKIEILVDLSHVNIKDGILMQSLNHCSTEEEKRKTLCKHAETEVLLKALKIDSGNENPREYIWDLLHYLLAKEILEIRFAINTIYDGRGMYHPKGGYFELTNGEFIAHDGSFNESESGHKYNNETFHVFKKSNEEERFNYVFNSVNEDWEGTPFVEVKKLSKKTLRKIKENAPREFPKPPKNKPSATLVEGLTEDILRKNMPSIPEELWGNPFKIRKHQEKAINLWVKQSGKGILWHATGSGKTITSLYAMSKIALGDRTKAYKIISIIHVPLIPLAEQWIEELKKFNLTGIECWGDSKKWSDTLKYELEKFPQADEPYILPIVVIDKTFFGETFQSKLKVISDKYSSRMLYVCDECHRFAKKGRTSKLPANPKYIFGLSGTPFNSSNQESIGDKELINYFGAICHKYEIEEALIDGVLTPYDYFHEICYLDDDEYDEIKKVEKDIARGGFDDDGEPNIASNIASGKRNRILAGIKDKFLKFEQLLSEEEIKTDKKQTLVFVGEGSAEIDSGKEVKEIKLLEKFGKVLKDNKWSWSKFTSIESPTERKNIIEDFTSFNIDAILAIKILDEGIDLPGVRKAFLLASTSNKRQFVQRRGRILRRSEGKEKSVIYDFIVLPKKGKDCAFVSREVDRLIEIGCDAIEESKKSTIELVNEIISSYKINEDTYNKATYFINKGEKLVE